MCFRIIHWKLPYTILLLATIIALLFRPVRCNETAIGVTESGPEIGNQATPSAPPELICAYGKYGARTGNLISETIRLSVVNLVTVIGVTVFAGFLSYVVFSLPSFVFAHAMACLFVNMITLRWSTWEWFGPGEAYVENLTSNRLVFIQHAISAAINKALHLVGAAVTARYSFLVEADRVKTRWITTIRVALGVSAALGMSAFSTYWTFTRGVPSFYRGTMSDAFNAAGCSGPMRWKELAGYVRFSEMLMLLTAPAFYIPYTGGLFAVAGITCSSITIAKGQWSGYHKVVAVGNLFILVPALFLFIVVPRRRKNAPGAMEQPEVEMEGDVRF